MLAFVALCAANALPNEEREGEWAPSPRSSQSSESRRGHLGRSHITPLRVQGALRSAVSPDSLAVLAEVSEPDMDPSQSFSLTVQFALERLSAGARLRPDTRGPPANS